LTALLSSFGDAPPFFFALNQAQEFWFFVLLALCACLACQVVRRMCMQVLPGLLFCLKADPAGLGNITVMAFAATTATSAWR